MASMTLLELAVPFEDRLEHEVLGDLLRARLDHADGLAGADDDEVDRRLLALLLRRVEDEAVADAGDADGAERLP